MTNIINTIHNVKAPVRSLVVPDTPSWTVEYEENDKRKKRSFLDITKAYSFYKQLIDSLSKKTLNNQH